MLFYSSKTHYMGEVHCCNTVIDFLAQERERGITICDMQFGRNIYMELASNKSTRQTVADRSLFKNKSK